MKRNLLFLLSLSLIVMTLSGCLFMTEVSGRVVDARATGAYAGLGGVSVTVETDGSSYTTSTNSSGYWSAMVWPGSSFTITYSKSGYYIPSMVTDLDSPVTTSSVVPAVPVAVDGTWAYDFVLVWDGSQDLDMYLTFPKGVYTAGSTFQTPYADDYTTTIGNGFGPLGDFNFRYIYPTDTQDFASGYVDRDSDGVESIKLNYTTLLLNDAINPVSDTPQNGLPTRVTDYHWTGIGNVYAEASAVGGNISETGAVLYVFNSENGDVSLSGVYPVPLSTTTKGASLVRLNFFHELIQLVPDVNVIPGGYDYFRSVTTDPVFNLR